MVMFILHYLYSNTKAYEALVEYNRNLYDLDNDISVKEKKGEKIYASPGTNARIKSLFNLMYDYALEYELADRNYARTFDISDDVLDEVEQNKHSHITFTENEIKILWENTEKVKFTD